MFDRKPLRQLGIAAEKDLRHLPLSGDKGRIQSSILNLIVLTFEINFLISTPKGPTHAEKFVGALIALVMGERVSVVAKLMRRVAGNNVDIDTEMVKLAENQLRNHTAIRLLTKKHNMISYAITEGR